MFAVLLAITLGCGVSCYDLPLTLVCVWRLACVSACVWCMTYVYGMSCYIACVNVCACVCLCVWRMTCIRAVNMSGSYAFVVNMYGVLIYIYMTCAYLYAYVCHVEICM